MTTIFWAGDSTVKQNSIAAYPQTGIGQVFDRYIRRYHVQIENYAENGRSTRQFLDEGRLDVIRERMQPGDFLFIQFGHNDEKANDPARYTDPDTDFVSNLETFIHAAREKGAVPVLITPLTRRLFRDPAAVCRHDAWAEAMRRTARRLDVALIDLTAMSERLVDELGEAAKQLYLHVPAGAYPHFPQGLADNTHLRPEGALRFGGLIAQALHDLGGEYAVLLCEEYELWQNESARLEHVHADASAAIPAGVEP